MNGNLQAQIAALDLVMTVRDISLGGFAVEAPMRFAHGEVHEFMLCRRDGAPERVRARATHCYAKRDRDHQFITGWEALGDPETARVMAGLVDRFLVLQEDPPSAVAQTQTDAYHGGPPKTGSPLIPAGSARRG